MRRLFAVPDHCPDSRQTRAGQGCWGGALTVTGAMIVLLLAVLGCAGPLAPRSHVGETQRPHRQLPRPSRRPQRPQVFGQAVALGASPASQFSHCQADVGLCWLPRPGTTVTTGYPW
jgi:hypothetical protein